MDVEDPGDDDKAAKDRAIALEYIALCVFLTGSLIYGIWCGVADLIR